MSVEPLPTPSAPPVAGPYSPAVRAGDCRRAGGPGRARRPTARWSRAAIEAETAPGARQHRRGARPTAASTWADVAKVGIFLTDLGNFAAVNALYEGAIGGHRPARTTVGVAALPAGAGVEIECWVYLPDA